MKNRIIESKGLFYPQYKSLLWGWMDYTETAVCDDGLQLNETIRFSTLDEARSFFNQDKIVIHAAK